MQKKVELLKVEAQEAKRNFANEKGLRAKVEGEFLANAANHEHEVRLRMDFERKLNDMHSDLRESKTLCEHVQTLLADTTI